MEVRKSSSLHDTNAFRGEDVCVETFWKRAAIHLNTCTYLLSHWHYTQNNMTLSCGVYDQL
eukprot:5294648-Amphidinium_carterae.1